MGRCRRCGANSLFISDRIGLCADCIREAFEEEREAILLLHREARRRDGLPPEVPRGGSVRCQFCFHRCEIPEGERGFCGVYENVGGRIRPRTGGMRQGFVSWYHDPLPTNCCAAWVCPGCSESGYPQYSYAPGPEYGYRNLAVFYEACNFDCLFCQNWTYRRRAKGRGSDTEELVQAVDRTTSCICFFGGDPTPQAVHALLAAREALKREEGRILRICWETNGGASPSLLRGMAQVSLQSGGCIKVDLKCWSEEMSYALCGVSNRSSLENFRTLATYHKLRPDPPFLIASTLLVPGYVDDYEVSQIARFIASLDPSIPYTLLAFHPDFLLTDLPSTPREYAYRCLDEAKRAGLKNVHLGNVHLLW